MSGYFKKNLSYSSMSSLCDCPRKFLLRYKEGWHPKKDKVALVFGDIVDKAVGHSLSSRHGDALARFRKLWIEVKERKDVEYTKRNTWAAMMKVGEELCQDFEENHKKKFEQVMSIQKDFKSPEDKNGIHVVGFADVIAIIDGKLTLIDVKTSAAKRWWDMRGDINSDPQLSLYYALAAAEGMEIEQVAFLVGFKDKPHWEWSFAKYNKDSANDARDKLLFCKNILAGGLFPKNISRCGDYGGCEFRPICDKLSEATIKRTLTTKKKKRH